MGNLFISFLTKIEAPTNAILVEGITAAYRIIYEVGDGNEPVLVTNSENVPENIEDTEVSGNKMVFTFTTDADFLLTKIEPLDVVKAKMDKYNVRFDYKVEYVETVSSTGGQVRNKYKCTVMYGATAFKRDGYEHVMDFLRTDAGNMIIPAYGHDKDDFSQFFNGSFICQRCKTDRLRNTYHVFRKDGVDYAFGTKCADEYFGFSFGIERAVGLITGTCQKIFGGADDPDSGLFGGRFRWYPESLFYRTLAYYTYNPLTYQKADMNGIGGTANIIKHTYTGISDLTKDAISDSASYTGFYVKAKKEFIACREFFSKLDVAGDNFKNSMKTAILSDEEIKMPGVVVYAVYYWLKTLADQKNTDNTTTGGESDYLGNVGDKLLFSRVRVVDMKSFNGSYGTSYICKMVSEGDVAPYAKPKKGSPEIDMSNKGGVNQLVWFTTKTDDWMTPGTIVSIVGVVKEHKVDTYNKDKKPIKTTYIKNGVLIKELGGDNADVKYDALFKKNPANAFKMPVDAVKRLYGDNTDAFNSMLINTIASSDSSISRLYDGTSPDVMSYLVSVNPHANLLSLLARSFAAESFVRFGRIGDRGDQIPETIPESDIELYKSAIEALRAYAVDILPTITNKPSGYRTELDVYAKQLLFMLKGKVSRDHRDLSLSDDNIKDLSDEGLLDAFTNHMDYMRKLMFDPTKTKGWRITSLGRLLIERLVRRKSLRGILDELTSDESLCASIESSIDDMYFILPLIGSIPSPDIQRKMLSKLSTGVRAFISTHPHLMIRIIKETDFDASILDGIQSAIRESLISNPELVGDMRRHSAADLAEYGIE